MALFEDLGKRVSNAAKTVTRRTQEAADAVKLNGQIASYQEQIEELFMQVGKAYFAVHSAGGNEVADKLCAEIEHMQAEQKSVREQLDALRNVRRCPNCGETQAASAAFCASCGTKMPEVKRPEPVIPEPVQTEEPEAAAPVPDFTIDWPAAPEENKDEDEKGDEA